MAKRFPARHKENRAGILFPERGIRRLNRRHVRRDVSHAGSRRYLTVRSAFVCARFGGGDSQAANRHRSHRSTRSASISLSRSFSLGSYRALFLSSAAPESSPGLRERNKGVYPGNTICKRHASTTVSGSTVARTLSERAREAEEEEILSANRLQVQVLNLLLFLRGNSRYVRRCWV